MLKALTRFTPIIKAIIEGRFFLRWALAFALLIIAISIFHNAKKS